MKRDLVSFLALVFVSASIGANGCAPDACSFDENAAIELGEGVGGAFEAFEDEQEVTLSTAPQGGFGVAIVIETKGITASDSDRVDVNLVTEIDGEETGQFLVGGAPLLCKSDGEGGAISGVVVGFDSERYGSNDDLLELNGSVVDLVVTVISDEQEVEARKPVTLRVGG